MSLWTYIFEFFHPCFHNWERVVELKDRPENPSAVTIVLICTDCGKMRQETFVAPKAQSCPPHQWETTGTGQIVEGQKNMVGAQKAIPVGTFKDLRCIKCGEVTRKSLMTGMPT